MFLKFALIFTLLFLKNIYHDSCIKGQMIISNDDLSSCSASNLALRILSLSCACRNIMLISIKISEILHCFLAEDKIMKCSFRTIFEILTGLRCLRLIACIELREVLISLKHLKLIACIELG